MEMNWGNSTEVNIVTLGVKPASYLYSSGPAKVTVRNKAEMPSKLIDTVSAQEARGNILTVQFTKVFRHSAPS